MQHMRILIIEDDIEWQKLIETTIRHISKNITIDTAKNDHDAYYKIFHYRYDLITIDLSIETNNQIDLNINDLPGMLLLKIIRSSSKNKNSCVIIITGFPSFLRMREAFKQYKVYDFLEKLEFNEDTFQTSIRHALRESRMQQAEQRWSERCFFMLTFDNNRLISATISGPNLQGSHTNLYQTTFDFEALIKRTDDLNIFIVNDERDAWRPSARNLGQEIYQIITADRRVSADLALARHQSADPHVVWLHIAGPQHCLGLPFELLHDGDFLGLTHIITRQIAQPGSALSRKSQPFHLFIKDRISKDRQPLRILVIGIQPDGRAAGAETEARLVAEQIQSDLTIIDIPYQITLLTGADASYQRIEQELREEHYHIVHYAGQANTSDDVPETNGVVLPHGGGYITLDTTRLNLLFSNTQVQMVFLSCCLSARNALDRNRGDFYGIIDALVSADVPVVLGYRWTITNAAAQQLAERFYHSLWRTFSPGTALLEARKHVVWSGGRSDQGWATPVLIIQNT